MSISEPVRSWHLRRRVAIGKEMPERLCERYGEATVSRPEGPLLWVHAASNGEALASLPLVDEMRTETPELQVLMTTFTVTGADLIAKHAPYLLHQFKPSENPVAVARFLDHWRPDFALFVESELWPNLLVELGQREIPMALVNGHLSEKSARGWRVARRSFCTLLEQFSALVVKSHDVKARMTSLGLGEDSIIVAGELKASRPVQRPDDETYAVLKGQIGGRPVFLAASTHPGEEEAAIAAHEAVLKRVPALLTIIAPRHERRGNEIEALIKKRGHTVHRRSQGQFPSGASIYLADTTGEMPLWYALSPIVFIGAGWSDSGGHNPLEAAQVGCAILSGPKVHASQAAYDRLTAADAVRFVENAKELSAALNDLLDLDGRPNVRAREMGRAAESAAALDPAPLERTMDHLRPLIKSAFR